MQPATTDSTKAYEFLAWLELNKKRLAFGIGIGLLLFVVVYVYSHFRGQKELAGNRALLALQAKQAGAKDSVVPAADLLKLAGEYESTSAGERALLLAAGNLFAQGDYAQARKYFEQFQNDNSGSPLAPLAAFGTAASLDALDQVDAALAAYQSVVNQFPEDAVAPRARLAMGTLHEAKNQPEQAHRIYDQLSKQIGVGRIASEAGELLEKLERRFPHLSQPTNAPVASATTTVTAPPTTPPSNAVSTVETPAPAAATQAPPAE